MDRTIFILRKVQENVEKFHRTIVRDLTQSCKSPLEARLYFNCWIVTVDSETRAHTIRRHSGIDVQFGLSGRLRRVLLLDVRSRSSRVAQRRLLRL